MAFIDYGAIAFKNKKLISTELFTPMKETCGFSDKDSTETNFDGNQFVVCGDKNLIIGFYKAEVAWRSNLLDWSEHKSKELFNSGCYKKWKYWGKTLNYTLTTKAGTEIARWENCKISVKPKNGYYVAQWEYKGDTYKVYFGYGVDLDFYKKTKRVNYYISPEYYFKELVRKFKKQ